MGGQQLQPGTVLNNRYRIIQVIGKGGMGTVYKAEHLQLDTILAIKEVRAPQSAEIEAQILLEQCRQEARFLVRLHHPNLPKVTDAFVEDDRFFVAMEYIEGVTLEAQLRSAGPDGLPVVAVIDWALQITDVLAYLHSQEPPIIFRDLKPSNVMLQADGRIRLIDFGIARRFQPGAVKDTDLLGSVGYSPPEQFGRHQTDNRSDIYALGATLHHLVTGRDPALSPFKFAYARSANPSVPDALAQLIEWCVRLDAVNRPQTVHDVAMALVAIRQNLAEATARVAFPQEAESAPVQSAGSGPNIILTNPTLRSTGRTTRSANALADRAASGKTGPPSAQTSPGQIAASGQAARRTLPSIVAALGVLAVAIATGASGWMLMHPRRVISTPPSASQPPGGRSSANPARTTTESTGDDSVTAPVDTGEAAITETSRFVTIDNVELHPVQQDIQGHSWLRISLSGTAHGQVGDHQTIAAFFYNAQGVGIASALPQSSYTSQDGKLSVARAIVLSVPSQPFTFNLDIPMAAFPINPGDSIQFHCVAFYGDQKIGESRSFVMVPPSYFGTSGTDTGNGQSTPDKDNSGGSIATPGRTWRVKSGGE